MADERYFQTDEGRVFIQQSPGPSQVLSMLGCAKVGGVTQAEGDEKSIYCPDPTQYKEFVEVGTIKGAPTRPTTKLEARLGLVNLLWSMKCQFDLQINYGKCKDPNDKKNGWEYGLVLWQNKITNRSTNELTAMTPEQRAEIITSADVTFKELIEKKRIAFASKAGTLVDREVVDILVCDTVSCGDCEPASDGCQRVYAIMKTSGGSPGILAEIAYTLDGGDTWYGQTINTLASNEDPDAGACISDYVVVISNDSCSLHYIDKDNLTSAQNGSWTEMATGFVAAKCPNAMFSIDASHTWIVGDGGYIYFAEDPTIEVTVQDAGIASTQILRAVHFLNTQRGLVVGNVNTVLVTENGGETWSSKTGPAVGVSLTACWVDAQNTFWVGSEVGRLYYSEDGGDTWTEKSFPGSGAGRVRDIKFVAPGHPYGYMAHNTATPAGRILRTFDHGNTWYVLPEGTASMAANDYLNKVAICDANRIWAGGLADDGTDGIILLGD